MDATEAIKMRRSVGRTGGDISAGVIRELIEAATWAPNHKLTEPWRFTVAAGEARSRLGAFWGAVAATERGFEGEEAHRFAEGESAKLLRAPVVVVVSCRTDVDPVVASEDHSATAAAIENFLLAAHARGLGAIWRTGAMAYHREVKRFLGIDDDSRIIGIVYVGQADAAPAQGRPRDVDRVIHWL